MSKMKSKPKPEPNTSQSRFENFREFARKIVNVPKKEIDEQEKVFKERKGKEKAEC